MPLSESGGSSVHSPPGLQPLSVLQQQSPATMGFTVFPGAEETSIKSFLMLWINEGIHHLDFEECTQKVQDSLINQAGAARNFAKD